MKCKRKECKDEQLIYLSNIVTGIPLYGCPKCGLVYYGESRMAEEDETVKEARNRKAAEPMLAPVG